MVEDLGSVWGGLSILLKKKWLFKGNVACENWSYTDRLQTKRCNIVCFN